MGEAPALHVGDYDTNRDRFIPNHHGRMTWVDNTYFAPEALVDDNARQIVWAWLVDNSGGEEAKGWSGVYGLPRSLWLGEDNTDLVLSKKTGSRRQIQKARPRARMHDAKECSISS